MTRTWDILDNALDIQPACQLDALLKHVPAKWVVYLMADEADHPVQLLCVKNLRYSLRRRLGELDQSAGPSKRIDYRQLVRRIHWRRVYSAFEADVVYLEAARRYFPGTYRGMMGLQPAWFIHVDPDARFPRYTRTIDLDIKSGQLIGPVEDKHAASRLIEQVLDWFDLCRYYNILVDSPHATACAYKEMGKCPAPCDGSISMENYRYLVQWSADTLVSPRALIEDATRRMKLAAAELKFESAARIKQYIDSLSQLGKGPYRHVRRLRDFKYLSIQPGPRDHTAKVFLITPGEIEELVGLIDLPREPGQLLSLALSLAAGRGADSLDAIGAERVGVVSYHLLQSRAAQGVFLPLDSIDEKQIIKAFRDVQEQKKEQAAEESEGVMKELQTL
ncbi:UvrB/UvrC motif-containing protein [Fontivita pretiosa]|uniref:UvrB/UvrC motif-containing protein n=1 Tax=Fontivita pretiosa TaxID=2989684 RepID=UPI003D16B9CF